MSNDLELIVRPSETIDYAPAKQYYVPGRPGVPNTRLLIGRSGSGKTFSGSGSTNMSFYCKAYVAEKKRPFAGS